MPLHPPVEPYFSSTLQVDEMHSLYYELSGNPEGEPVLFLHGGPGSKTEPKHRQFFDPSRYKIVLFDQRGCGKSTPYASIQKNTTWDLVEDIEKLRKELGIDQWALFGGSWGSTLALVYAIRHPNRVTKMILRGVFLATAEEIEWFYHSGARRFYPKQWEEFVSFVPEKERGDLLNSYYRRLTSDNSELAQEAAKRWARWELTCIRLDYDGAAIEEALKQSDVTAIARIETHYFINGCFLTDPHWILHHLDALQEIPIYIVQGRYDLLCPPEQAYRLLQAHPRTTLHIVQQGGHSSSDNMMTEALVHACNLKNLDNNSALIK